MIDVCQVGLHAPIPTWGDMDLSPILGDSPGSTAHNVPGNIFTTDGDAEHFPPPQKWRRQIPLPSRAARSAEEMAERRRLFLRPECKFRGLQPYMDGEESRDAGWRRAGLMAAAQRGDADAYGELLNEIGPVLMRFLRARVRDAQEAEDLYQETLHGHPSRATRLRCRTGRSSRGCSPLPGTSSPRTPSGTACARRARCWSPPRPSGRRRATAT